MATLTNTTKPVKFGELKSRARFIFAPHGFNTNSHETYRKKSGSLATCTRGQAYAFATGIMVYPQ